MRCLLCKITFIIQDEVRESGNKRYEHRKRAEILPFL